MEQRERERERKGCRKNAKVLPAGVPQAGVPPAGVPPAGVPPAGMRFLVWGFWFGVKV